MAFPEWLRTAHETQAAILAEEATALPPGWAASPAWQVVGGGGGLNNYSGEAGGGGSVEVAVPADQAVARMWGRGAGSGAGGGGPLYGRTIRQREAGAAPGSGGAAVPPTSPLERARRRLYYLRASTLAKGMKDERWILK